MIYRMIAGSNANNPGIIDLDFDKIIHYPITSDGYGMGMVAESEEQQWD
jgi:hypothetical protein